MRRRFYVDGKFDRDSFVIGGTVFLGVVCILLLYAFWKYRRCRVKSVGTITDIEKINDVHSGQRYRLFITFPTETGLFPGEIVVSASKVKYGKGDVVTVMFDPKKPQRFYLKDYAFWTLL